MQEEAQTELESAAHGLRAAESRLKSLEAEAAALRGMTEGGDNRPFEQLTQINQLLQSARKDHDRRRAKVAVLAERLRETSTQG